jgi:hypothetical protein
MSCRKIYLGALQQSFFNREVCIEILQASRINDDDGRPRKRRKLDLDEEGWASIVEVRVECEFADESSAYFPLDLETTTVEAVIAFDDPIMTVFYPITDQALFAFVCHEREMSNLERIMWFQRLVLKDPSINRCIRFSTSLSIHHRHETIQRSIVSFRVDIRFDQNLSTVNRLSPKDRISILDYAFDKPSAEVNADKFYAGIGKLPKNYVKAVDEKSLQHPSITCRLFPFQKRAVAWMLQREGIPSRFTSDSSVDRNDLPPLWEMVRDLDERIFYLNRHQAFTTRDQTWISNNFKPQAICGGILAEVFLAV